MEGGVQWAWIPLSLRPAPSKKTRLCLPFFLWVSSQAFVDRLAKALTSQVFKETKTEGEGHREQRWRRMTCQMRKKTYWKGQRTRKTERKTYWTNREVQPLTIWLRGWQQPSSVFLELYNTPNYPVRKIKESQKAVEWKEESKFVPLGWEWQRKSDTHCICKVCQHVWIKSRLSQTDTPWHLSKSFIKT